MEAFDSCFTFTRKGRAIFRSVFANNCSDRDIDLSDVSIVRKVEGTTQLVVKECGTAKELAGTILSSLNSTVHRLLKCKGLWCWLTFVFRHQLFARNSNGLWITRENHRWDPADPNDWLKGQRHLVRMPVHLLATFGESADHLLCGKPSILPEVREQLTSQQDMFDLTFQQLARTLYFDDHTRQLKMGAAGKGPGSARRLAQVRRQFDMTWDLSELDVETIMAMLPSEFDRFKPAAPVR